MCNSYKLNYVSCRLPAPPAEVFVIQWKNGKLSRIDRLRRVWELNVLKNRCWGMLKGDDVAKIEIPRFIDASKYLQQF